MGELVASVSLEYAAGDDLLLEFTVTRDGAAVDISGMTIRSSIARDVEQTPVLSTEASPVTITEAITDGAGGIFTLAIAGDDTAALAGDYDFNVEVEDGSGNISTVSRGTIEFVRKVRKT